MRAVLCTEFNQLKGLKTGETPAPVPADDQVLLEVHCASASYMDYLMVSGGYQLRPELPFVPGTDAAGIVLAVGKDVTRFQAGDRIACTTWFGAYGEQMIAREGACTALPDGVSFRDGAVVLQSYGTAYYALLKRAQLEAGETLFVSGAAGGVGLAVIDVARKLGARIIAGVGSDEKADIVKRYGAEAVINYRSEDLRERIKSLTDGKGVDVCFDNIGGEIFHTLSRVMNWGGRLMPIGFTSGDIPKLAMNLPLVKGYSVVGVYTGAWWEKFPEQAIAANAEVMKWLAEGEIHPHIDREVDFEDAVTALQMIADRTVQGRVVINIRH